MSMQHFSRRNRIDLELQGMGKIGLERKLQRSHDRIGQFFVRWSIEHDGTGRFSEKIEKPFGHIFIQRSQHRQQVILTALLEKGLQCIDGRIGVAVIVPARVDEMDQISGQGIGTRPTLHGNAPALTNRG